ncbi:MAG: NADH-quinone oxidoreductase subunit NuoG, partial [Desulfatitalea sp.]
MATIYIDNKPYTVADGQNLLQACLTLGFDLPYFCWHPALGSVGACRMCAVKRFKDEKDPRGELVMACMTPADEGTRIAIDDPEAVQFRASIIEWLMINHPHDCPVCDEGGECHLQDMTVMSGHNYRAYRFAKRTHRNQDLGPFINHEMNRCIQCYRCVRFYHDYAGGRDLNVFACHDHVYFGRFEDGALESEFSGNLVEICPTGVFTDRTFKEHFSRKWDLQTAPAICGHCGLGCNTIPGERYGRLRRVRNRYHHQINGYFLCDRGRYGYEHVHSDRRIVAPLQQSRDGSTSATLTDAAALEKLARLLTPGRRVIGIGSPRASLEANFALRTLVGAEHFFAGLSEADQHGLAVARAILTDGPVPAATLQGAGLCDAALVLGEDVTQSAPLLALNLRRLRYRKAAVMASGFQLPAWNDAGVRELAQLHQPNLFIAATHPTRLDDEAWQRLLAAPAALARFGFAVWAALDAQGPPTADSSDPVAALAWETGQALLKAQRPLVVAGLANGQPALLQAAANIAWRLKQKGRAAELCFCVPESNSMGLALMQAQTLEAAFTAVAQGAVDTVVILENDLYRRAPAEVVDALLAKARHVVVLDHLATATTAKAHILLPTAPLSEATGTLVNNEGRAQRSHAVMSPTGSIRAAWRWLQAMAQAGGRTGLQTWQNPKDVMAALAQTLPLFQPAVDLDPAVVTPTLDHKLPRQSHRYSGRTAMRAHIDVHEPKPEADPDGPLAYSMEGYDGRPPEGLVTRCWAPGWNSEQALNKFQSEIDGPLQDGAPGHRLIVPATHASPAFFIPPTQAQAAPGPGEFRLVAIHHIFGSEELSMAAQAVAQRAPEAYVALAPDNGMAAAEGEVVRLQVEGRSLDLPVKLMPGLAPQTIGWPVGLPGMPTIM